ncbi:MAG: oligosaccharide flippase family protein, partial [Candidatus Heimdallarchaeaceae archaeon]
MNMGRIFRSGIFLFIGTVVSSLLNFVFWIVISRYTSPDIIGSAAVIIALQSVLAMVFSFGLPAGLQKFVGRDAAKGDTESISMYFSTALLFLLI